jgi:hypothetical protein
MRYPNLTIASLASTLTDIAATCNREGTIPPVMTVVNMEGGRYDLITTQLTFNKAAKVWEEK